jgi:hypothetical protein
LYLLGIIKFKIFEKTHYKFGEKANIPEALIIIKKEDVMESRILEPKKV